MHRSRTIYKRKQSKMVLNKYVSLWTKWDGLFHWRKRYYALWACFLSKSDGLELKCLND